MSIGIGSVQCCTAGIAEDRQIDGGFIDRFAFQEDEIDSRCEPQWTSQ